MMSQTERIIKYLKERGKITSFEAYAYLGITQLGARIDDLQKQGYVFKKEQKTGKDRYGKPTRFVEYSLMED